MLASFPAPVLSVTIDAVRDLEGGEALSGLWTLFTKCKGSLKDGYRLENISWRLWYRELASANSYRPPTPDSDSAAHSHFPLSNNSAGEPPCRARSPRKNSNSTSFSVNSRKDTHSPQFPHHSNSPPFSKFICDIIPSTVQIKSTAPATPKQRLVPPPDKPNTDHIPSLPTPTAEHSLSLPSQVNPDSYLSPGFPHVVISHPTPPPTPILGDQKSTSSSTTLPVSSSSPLASSNPSIMKEQRHIEEPASDSSGSRSPEPEPMVTAGSQPRDNDESSKPADRRFFLQHSPDGESPERPEDASPTKTTSELTGSANSTHIKSGPSPPPTKHHMSTVTKVRGRGKEPAKHVHVARRPNLAHRRSHHGVPAGIVQPGDRSKVAFNMEPASPTGSRPPVMKSQGARAKGGNEQRKAAISTAKADDAPPSGAAAAANAKQNTKIVMASTSSEFETTSDSDDGDDSWVSDEVTRVPPKPSNKALDMRRTRSQPSVAVAEARRAREAELETQRVRDLFAKVPKRAYVNNLARTRNQSGMLSQLLNPDPLRFPEHHPYRLQRTQSQGGQTTFATHDLRGLQFIQPQQITKSTAAAPIAAQVNTPGILSESQKVNRANGHLNSAHRPKGRPQEVDSGSDSGSDDPNNSVQLSKSIAYQKLEDLASRHARSNRGQLNGNASRGPSNNRRPPTSPPLQPPMPQHPVTPIPLAHPYNLPPPEPPSTPRTTRRVMLQRELSESLRRNLLWERRVSRTNLTTLASTRQSREDLVKPNNPPNPPLRRHSEDDHGRRQAQNAVAPPSTTAKLRRHASGGVLGDGLRPLTTVRPEPGLTSNVLPPTVERDEREVRREQQRLAVARNRSWVNDFHYTGW